MSEKLEIDQDKIVHEDQYKMNLDLEIPETKEAIPSTQMNTEEKQEIITEQIIENKPKAVNEIKGEFMHNRVIITEPTSNNLGVAVKNGIIPGDLSIDSFNAVPKVNMKKGDNPYEITEDYQISSRTKTAEEKKTKLKSEKKKNVVDDEDYLKREMYEECRSSRCRSCNVL